MADRQFMNNYSKSIPLLFPFTRLIPLYVSQANRLWEGMPPNLAFILAGGLQSNSAEPRVNYFWKGWHWSIYHVRRGHQDNYFVQPPLPHRPFFYNSPHPAPAHFYGANMRSCGTIQSDSAFVGIHSLDTPLWRLWLILGHFASIVSVIL